MLSVHPGVKAELMDPYGNQRRVRTRFFDRFVMCFGDTEQAGKQSLRLKRESKLASKQASEQAISIISIDFLCVLATQ